MPPPRLFVTSAPVDHPLAGELLRHLLPLCRQGLISVFADHDMLASTDIPATLQAELSACSIFVPLISKDLFAERADLLDAARRRSPALRIVPVLLHPFHLQGDPLSGLPPLPHNGVPVTQWPTSDAAFADVVAGLRRLVSAALPTGGGDLDPAQMRRVFGHGEPLLSCDRGQQWSDMQAILRDPGHQLVILPGEAGQGHGFFLSRLEAGLLHEQRVTLRKLSWRRPQSIHAPPYPTSKTDLLNCLALALGGPPGPPGQTDPAAALPDLLRVATSEQTLLLIHPLIGRAYDDGNLLRYYREYLPEVLSASRLSHPCKLVQPIEWPVPAPPRRGVFSRLRGGPPPRQPADDARALVAGLCAPHGVLRPVQLGELPSLQPGDVIQFLRIVGYASDQNDPELERRHLAQQVCQGAPSSEQILRRLCAELPEDLLR